MRKLFIAVLFISLGCQLNSQDTINVYDVSNTDGIELSYPTPSGYIGEYQVYLSQMYWLDYSEDPYTEYMISYDIECVSYPFVPEDFNIEDEFSDCIDGGSTRSFTVLSDALLQSISTPLDGYGWHHQDGKTVFQHIYPDEFNANETSYPSSLASRAFITDDLDDNAIIPHSVLRISLNVHETTSISSDIIYKISWIYDNTRGRMKNYPFINSNTATQAKEQYDVIFTPNIVYGNLHYYSDTGNSAWFEGAHPSGLTPSGSINYFSLNEVPNPAVYFHPGNSGTSFPANLLYLNPAPYSLLTAPLCNSNGDAYAGYNDDGDITTIQEDVQNGQPHTYIIDDTINLSNINSDEKIIYNPSCVFIDANITFPEDYKFLTAHGRYPDKAWVTENNPGFTDLRNVLCPSDQVSSSGEFLSVYKVIDTLTIEPNVTIMDAIFDSTGTLRYHPNYTYGNFEITIDPKLVFLSDTVTVSDSLVTWENVIDFEGDVILVDSGSTLNIENTLTMAENSKIIVKRGAKLVVDDALITCTNMWKGIEVWGTKTATATTVGAHGKVYIQNDATIKNALYGVRTIKMDYDQAKGTENFNYAYSGGQVFVYNGSTFKNCLYGVYFYEYDKENASIFSRAKFETSDSLLANDGDPKAGIYMTKVKGVAIKGCTFINSMDSIDMDIEDRGKGIHGLESTFTIDEYENASGPNTRTVFENLHYGIFSSYITSNRFMTVENSNFIKNWRGIYASAMDAGQITKDTFLIDQEFVTDGGCGLYLDNCTGYWVEGNHLYSCWEETGLGMVVNNSGGDANEIYRNTFDNLDHGISAQGQNKEPRSIYKGLQILCNDFDDCIGDIFVPSSQSGKGIAISQGANDTIAVAMAGNLFYHVTVLPDGNYDDLHNLADDFYYYYPQNPDNNPQDLRSIPKDITSNSIIDVDKTITSGSWTYEDGCPSQFSSGGTKSSGGENIYKDLIIYYSEQIEESSNTLNSLIDGGNTQSLNMEVELSTPPESIEVYNELMGNSPFISETVVKSAIDKENVLPNSMVRDVMVANSHSATSDELMNKLDERNTPMPDYMKAQVLEAKENISIKTELESKLSRYALLKGRAINNCIRHYSLDTMNPESSSDSLVALYEMLTEKKAKYKLAMLHLSKNEFTDGLEVLSGIPLYFDLTEKEQIQHNHIVQYHNFLQSLIESGISFSNENEQQISALGSLYQEDRSIVSIYTRNILLELGEIEYVAPIQVPDYYKSKKMEEEYMALLNSNTPSQLSVFPTPAKDYIIVEYHMDFQNGREIEIKNTNGVIIKTIKLNKLDNQITINTQSMKPGIYIVSLINDSQTIESVKFILIN